MLSFIELEIYKDYKKIKTEYWDIKEVISVSDSQGKCLVVDGLMGLSHNDNNQLARNIEIFNIDLFMVATIVSKDSNKKYIPLIAVFTNQDGDLDGHVISGLPENMRSVSDAKMINYEAYLSIAKLTGETEKVFLDHYEDVKKGKWGRGSILIHDNRTYNADEHEGLFKLIDNKE